MIGLPVILYILFKKNPVKELCLNKFKLSETLKKGLIIFSEMILVLIGLSIIFYLIGYSDTEKVSEIICVLSPVTIIYILIISVTAEEIFFRGFLIDLIEKIFKKMKIFSRKKENLVKGILIALIASALFALPHYSYGSIVEIIGAFALGFVLAINFIKTRNLYFTILAHAIYNALVFGLCFIK